MQTELIISFFFFFNPLPATCQALFSSIIPSELPTNWCLDLTWLGWRVRNHLYFSVLLVHKSHTSGGRCLLPFAYSVGQFSLLLLENKASALAHSRLPPSVWHQWPLWCSTTWGLRVQIPTGCPSSAISLAMRPGYTQLILSFLICETDVSIPTVSFTGQL